jgi:hypothetical protein
MTDPFSDPFRTPSQPIDTSDENPAGRLITHVERINEELKRRTHVIRIFPNQESVLRLIRALAVEIHEGWIEAHRYLNMEMLREQRKQLQLLEAA